MTSSEVAVLLAADGVPPSVLVSTGGALLGVMVGGVLNGVVQASSDRARQRRLAHAGVRLVRGELGEIETALGSTVDHRVWRRAALLPQDAWRNYREVLAQQLPDGLWETVAGAMVDVQGIHARLEHVGGAGPTSDPLSDELLQQVTDVRLEVIKAIRVLQ
jgi:hypothetical protein